MEKKLLFTDLDGTLLNDKKEITDGNRRAVEAMLSAGHSVIIATGRPLSSALKQAARLGLNGPGCLLICFNGCTIYDIASGRTLYHEALSFEDLYVLFDEAARRDLHIQTYDESHVLVEPRCDTWRVHTYCTTTLMDLKVIPDVRTLTRRPEKALLIDHDNKDKLDSFRAFVDEYSHGRPASTATCPEYLEVMNVTATKGSALVRTAELLGVPIRNTVAAGDAENDLTLIKAAGTGAVMRNGSDDVKAVADYITERDNNNDGVAEIIERFIL